jgi:hypothetical protein
VRECRPVSQRSPRGATRNGASAGDLIHADSNTLWRVGGPRPARSRNRPVGALYPRTIGTGARQAKEIDDLREVLEQSREKVGVDPEELRSVFATALARAGSSLDAARAGEIGGTLLFRFDPDDPAFAGGGWPEALDDLRIRRRKRSEKLKDWRATVPLRAVSFRPALTEDKVDAEGVLQLHLEHRLVRRLLSRFRSQGFSSNLSRACVVSGPGAQPRVVLLGRLALYGPLDWRFPQVARVVSLPQTVDELAKRIEAFWSVLEGCTTLDDIRAARRFNPALSLSGRAPRRATCEPLSSVPPFSR